MTQSNSFSSCVGSFFRLAYRFISLVFFSLPKFLLMQLCSSIHTLCYSIKIKYTTSFYAYKTGFKSINFSSQVPSSTTWFRLFWQNCFQRVNSLILLRKPVWSRRFFRFKRNEEKNTCGTLSQLSRNDPMTLFRYTYCCGVKRFLLEPRRCGKHFSRMTFDRRSPKYGIISGGTGREMLLTLVTLHFFPVLSFGTLHGQCSP